MTRLVYHFDDEIDGASGDLLGGKGGGLAAMTQLGLPVPPGFTLTTEVCAAFLGRGLQFPEQLPSELNDALAKLEGRLGRVLGDVDAPLLLSVRSGASVSMPGMMDTVLNLGLNDETVEGLARASGDRRFALDCHRRLLEMYGDVAMDVSLQRFDDTLRRLKERLGDPSMADADLDEAQLEELISQYKRLILDVAGRPFPEDVSEQLWGAIAAVFRSWNNPRARRYRLLEGIPADIGTACTVQAMVFGNLGETSGSGVAFTRNPSTGEPVIYGEHLSNAQGEDVLAGVRIPCSLSAQGAPVGREDESLEIGQPEVFAELGRICATLEQHFGDMQDIEFTVEEGRPYILQTRRGKRSALASVRIAVDMVEEGLLDREHALLNIDASQLDQLLHARLPEPEALAKRGIHPLASGLPASPGAAIGRIVFHADDAVKLAAEGREVILVRRETSPEDIHGMKSAEGVLTATGGMTSHAAVVARGLGRCCVAGCSSLIVDYEAATLSIHPTPGSGEEPIVLHEGDLITLDGSHGKLYAGEVDVIAATRAPQLETVMEWADSMRRLQVFANADTPRAARAALSFGAEGVGLCRTEHMFFAEDRLLAVRCLMLAEDEEDRERLVRRIEPIQRADFEEIFRAMDGKPVTLRLLDWPLHEFMPREEADLQAIAEELDESLNEIRERAAAVAEVNPMLGHRGVRLGLTREDIYRAQVRAILSAALNVAEEGVQVRPELMVPVVGLMRELMSMRSIVDGEARLLFAEAGRDIAYRVGTMIELPRACVVADRLAEAAEFFSFGTNDLTQTTLGISRDDSSAFLPTYVGELGILDADPFVELDVRGVGQLMEIACEKGRATRPEIVTGVCGEQGGDPRSIDFFEKIGLDYVSCSPPRLPIARLAAAQASIRHRSVQKSTTGSS